MSYENSKKPLLGGLGGESSEDSGSMHGHRNTTKHRLKRKVNNRKAYRTLMGNYLPYPHSLGDDPVSFEKGVHTSVKNIRTYVQSLNSHEELDLRHSDFDALEDEYAVPHVRLSILAIDATRR